MNHAPATSSAPGSPSPSETLNLPWDRMDGQWALFLRDATGAERPLREAEPYALQDEKTVLLCRGYGASEHADLSILASIPDLHTLEIKDCPRLTTLPSLSSFGSLRCLRLEGVGLSALPPLPSGLTSLEVKRSPQLTHVGPLPDSLEELQFHACEGLSSLPTFGASSSLRRLGLRWCVGVTELSFLQGATGLASLDLGSCAGLTDLGPLASLPALRHLDLSWCTSLTDLQPLSGMSSLEHIVLEGCHGLASCEGLPAGLVHLTLQDCATLQRTPDLSAHKALTTLLLDHCAALAELGPLPPSLEHLSLRGCTALTRCDGLGDLASMRRLSFKGCSSLVSVDSLPSGLAHLSFGECSALGEVPPLHSLHSLRSLRMERCRSLTRLESLPPHLRVLDLQFCLQLASVSDLSELSSLESLSLRGCRSLKELPRLPRGLVRLDLSRCIDLRTLASISLLDSLQTLSLNGTSLWKEWNHFPRFLRTLTLRRCEGLSSCPDLSVLTSLQCLDLSDNPQLCELGELPSSLEELDLSLCPALEDFTALTEQVSLRTLAARDCNGLRDLTVLRSLSRLVELDLSQCQSVEELPSFAGLSSLQSLRLYRCTELHTLGALPASLRKLSLQGCEKLRALPSLSALSALQSVDVTHCHSLRRLELPPSVEAVALRGCESLEELLLRGASKLRVLPPLRRMNSLRRLELEGCESLTELKVFSCQRLQSLHALSSLTSLVALSVQRCPALVELPALPTSLRRVDLGGCLDLTSVVPLLPCEGLEELVCADCPNIRDLDLLSEHRHLRRLEWTRETTSFGVLASTAALRRDRKAIADAFSQWLSCLDRSEDPNLYLQRLVAACAVGEGLPWSNQALLDMVAPARARGLAEHELTNALTPVTWQLWAEAVVRGGEQAMRLPLERVFFQLDGAREITAVLNPVLTALADLPQGPETDRDWLLALVDQTLLPLVSDPDLARLAAPGAAVFYASLEARETVQEWLKRGTHPRFPEWRDRILLALLSRALAEQEWNRALRCACPIETPALREEALRLLQPPETLRELAGQVDPQAHDGETRDSLPSVMDFPEWRDRILLALLSRALAEQEWNRALRCAFPIETPALREEALRLLQLPETLRELASLVESQALDGETRDLLSRVLEEERWRDYVSGRKWDPFAETLQQKSSVPLLMVEAIAGRLVKAKLMSEEDRDELLEEWTGAP